LICRPPQRAFKFVAEISAEPAPFFFASITPYGDKLVGFFGCLSLPDVPIDRTGSNQVAAVKTASRGSSQISTIECANLISKLLTEPAPDGFSPVSLPVNLLIFQMKIS
jgi:hypothetical protein